jgi:hypothetical protein
MGSALDVTADVLNIPAKATEGAATGAESGQKCGEEQELDDAYGVCFHGDTFAEVEACSLWGETLPC